MRPVFKSFLALFSAATLLSAPALAFQSPLSDEAVREAYFLGQRRDESMAAFLKKYTKLLPPPKSGPHIASVTFLTPFALLVQYSSRQTNFSAQQAAKDHHADDETVLIEIQFLPAQPPGAILDTPSASRSGAPVGLQMSSREFWRAFKYRIFDGDEEITTDDITSEPQFICGDGGCFLTGAIVYIRFPAAAFTSDSATILVTPPEGDPVAIDFDLSSLR